MIINKDENDIIQEHVGTHCGKHALTPLIVADCGSRAWGYNTEESDFDVKVLFVHNDPNKYNSLWELKDCYTVQADDMHDYTYWDIGKFLHLLWKGNAQTYELVASPKIYYTAYEANNIFDFTIQACDERHRQLAFHYYGLAKKTHMQHINGTGETTLKKYVYAMRSLLYMENITIYKELPNLDFNKFVCGDKTGYGNGADLIKNHTVWEEVCDIMRLIKAGKTEVKSYPNIDKYLEDRLRYWTIELQNSFSKEKQINLLTSSQNFDIMYRNITK